MSSTIPIRYVGALRDVSGYGNAARQYINCLLDHPGVDVTLDIASFEQQKTHHGPILEKMKPFLGRKLDPKINIIHLTPENYPTYKVSGKYNIGYVAWETELLPDFWVELCNSMDELWVPSEWNVQVFKDSGVTVPVYCVPHVIDMPDEKNYQLNNIPVTDDAYKFYSIFQWIERKNPTALLIAYLTEFDAGENVCLVLKTYRLGFAPSEKNIIKGEIQNIKRALNLEHYPPIAFFGELMSSGHMAGLHRQCDCFVMPHRGEGFGIPFAEAMSYGKPTIATRYSGNLEFMNDENSYLINYQRTPVYKMLFPNYNAKMIWAQPDVMDLRAKMRYVFEHQEEACKTGAVAKQYIADNFNKEKIGNHMVDRLKQICEEKGL